MALNSLSEIETAPGAARRERASMKRETIQVRNEFIASAQNAILEKAQNGRALSYNGRVNLNWANMNTRTGGQLKKTSAEYRSDAGQCFIEAEDAFRSVAKLKDQIKEAKRDNRKDKRGAIIDSAVATVQTFFASEL